MMLAGWLNSSPKFYFLMTDECSALGSNVPILLSLIETHFNSGKLATPEDCSEAISGFPFSSVSGRNRAPG